MPVKPQPHVDAPTSWAWRIRQAHFFLFPALFLTASVVTWSHPDTPDIVILAIMLDNFHRLSATYVGNSHGGCRIGSVANMDDHSVSR